MTSIIKLEEIAMFVLATYLFSLLDLAWWWFVVFLLAPDIGMFGYAINNRIGAISYNLFHHKGIAVAVYLLGVYINNEWLLFAGIILFAHSCFDRILGYGLKYSDDFKNTHLGRIGRS